MELLVEIDEVVLPPVFGGAPLAEQEQAQVVDVVDLHHLARAPDGDPLERLAQEQELGPMLRREARGR